jgi:hypothetical protein
MLNPWLALTFKAMQIGLDAQNVILCYFPSHDAPFSRRRSRAKRSTPDGL